MRGTVRHVEWVGDDDPERLEAATVTLAADRLDALGVSRTTDYVTNWSLETTEGWVTSRLDVAVSGRGWSRRLVLVRDAHGRWSSDTETTGTAMHRGVRLDEPGIADAQALTGALDCDLALCPVTNTMPILRLGVLERPTAERHLVMAWVAIPSLAVLRSEQVYSSAAAFDPAAGHGAVHYESATRDFAADLTIDSDGLVVDYPQLARRIRTRP